MMTLPENAGLTLLPLARWAIAQRLHRDFPAPGTDQPWLREPGASFVTLTINGDLRGCIGSLVAHRPLEDDVVSNAQAAAFEDPRFLPLTEHELDAVSIEVSVLSEPVPMSFSSRDDALAQLRPGVDGVVLTAGHHRATFLPQVWSQLPSPGQFIGHLLRKAGLPADYWSPAMRLERYTVTSFEEA